VKLFLMVDLKVVICYKFYEQKVLGQCQKVWEKLLTILHILETIPVSKEF